VEPAVPSPSCSLSLSLDDLVVAFQTRTLPRPGWTHVAHLRVGAWHVHHLGAEAALPRLRDGIRRLNLAHGTANTPTGGYHETITAAYVQLIARFLSSTGADQALDRRVERMLAGPLAERSLLLRFWSRDSLMSERARESWVAPDLSPLALPEHP
jgi:hypothetical protein